MSPATRTRSEDRPADQLRSIEVERGFPAAAPASVLIRAGRTTVLCTASVSDQLPAWLAGKGKGWITAEYNMLPGSTQPRKPRDRGPKVDGRTTEIQRLIGRSLRSVADLRLLGERAVTVDCDVLEADGGTRTLSITGGFIALVEALIASRADEAAPGEFPLRDSIAAVSAGIVDGVALLDVDYQEDVAAAVDMNVVMTGSGQFVEIQGTGEEATFSDEELGQLLALTRRGIAQLTELQRATLGSDWPW